MAHKVSPLAPERFPDLPPIAGVRLGTIAAGVRYTTGRVDVMLAELAPGTTVAGVFTRSKTASAPVDWCRKALPGGQARAVIVNAGNANAFTGQAGFKAVQVTAEGVAQRLGCRPDEVYVASTGVIGEPLPAERITAVLDKLSQDLKPDHWAEAARAIMTTDTYPKGVTATARIGGTTVTINGFIKGSGMIAPDMATMLGFVFTDAALPADVMQALLTRGSDRSFNCITVDSDTSTSDTVLLFATGQAGNPTVEKASDPRLADFRRVLDGVLMELAHLVVKDGEGAEKLVAIRVGGAATAKAARRIGLAIANSPLVKTAIAAGDANWGRIVMAVGKSGEKADRDRLSISMGGVAVARNGVRVEGFDEGPVAAHMAGRAIDIDVDVGVGRASATVWTCDLTHAYIDINGSYRS
ncbi:glutamate N-acetyltransferase [Stella humosa]|uniref:Arginine biosynthesis bifunctional protein ArgJ n=1 Tax=Stella humosa TaxID=94 RepID=A0A3N1LL65_9PROT|nr:bifunctional glutamate N-acetyltransferase/amino-acid acetyltransferase ArgJ [Stella humosa]ROP91166.1 glutamate N-acetyltransferase [Stella humosa]BBK34482.1 arginine biosynthesis bifunctional protein ArgJ [Stella humosa]